MKYLKLFENWGIKHKLIIDEIKEFNFILEDEGCRVRYFHPGWSLDGFWISVITDVKVEEYHDNYTIGELDKFFQNLNLPYIDEWIDRIADICAKYGYFLDDGYDCSRDMNHYCEFYFKIWSGYPRKELSTKDFPYRKTRLIM